MLGVCGVTLKHYESSQDGWIWVRVPALRESKAPRPPGAKRVRRVNVGSEDECNAMRTTRGTGAGVESNVEVSGGLSRWYAAGAGPGAQEEG